MLEIATIKEVKLNFGIWCKNMRKSNDLSQEALARELAVSRITISKLENGENATFETILKILQYFDELKGLNLFIKSKNEDIINHKSLY